MILQKLKDILLISFPLILIVLFFIARFIAGRSIKPVKMITETSSRITRDNLKDRIVLPQNKDELFILSKSINDLLDRIESAVEREMQFEDLKKLQQEIQSQSTQVQNSILPPSPQMPVSQSDIKLEEPAPLKKSKLK